MTEKQLLTEEFSPEDFRFASHGASLKDKKPETRPVGYFRDAWRRFKKNKASIVALCIIAFLVLFALIAPLFSPFSMSFSDPIYRNRIPKNSVLAHVGIATGEYSRDLNGRAFEYFEAIGIGAAYDRATDTEDNTQGIGGEYAAIRRVTGENKNSTSVRQDAYLEIGFRRLSVTQAEYEDILAYEEETGLTVLYPMIDASKVNQTFLTDADDANVWFLMDASGRAVKDAQGNYQDIYLRDGEGNVRYYQNRDTSGLYVRVLYYNYFRFRNGTEPEFLFGSNTVGQDILVRLASGIRLSLLLAVGVSVINLLIGAIYGTIEGYYGGRVDLVMERIVDILSGVPFIIVATLFQLHLANTVGIVSSLLFAFVLTGWIGTSRRVRTQFYRFKGQEYVLAARTLGAGDLRLMFKHIFPNTLGTIITSSVLVIPSVIFSESMLTYLGIVNLSGSAMTSIGSMLSDGQGVLASYPHVIFFPAIVISLLMISFNLFGNGLRDAFNPSLRGVDE
ncbi:MAG TPA: ABC transporter permease [Candidatus Borkfalkia faecigallinarum]|uniref:ABC transporter permease n=1 Tax=Candidatus Borkfalkia faecigallinarum TaxID=2838509 RepID=A0A9D2AQC4_9FIRM|nr:ABC transporter permease [Candidatus Borkfalkia faecigallinarum]